MTLSGTLDLEAKTDRGLSEPSLSARGASTALWGQARSWPGKLKLPGLSES